VKKLTYKKSGVDIAKANLLVRSIKQLARKTYTKDVLTGIGGFGGLFNLDLKKYNNPVLVSSTDGVGTKLKIAFRADKHDTVGIDAVAMNVGDVLCTGARPLFFLDYIATGKIKHGVLKDVLKGIVEGCRQSGCALIGGELAEMPSVYKQDEYDIAGFCVGIVEKNKIIDGRNIRAGDVILGLGSSGLHSNGFSLARKALGENGQKRMAKELLKPTRIYVKPVLGLIEKLGRDRPRVLKGIAHVTGGAFYEKIPRIVPQGLGVRIFKGSWPVPEIFKTIQKAGNIDEKQMYLTFNMGIGMVLFLDKNSARRVRGILAPYSVRSWVIGEVVKSAKRVTIE